MARLLFILILLASGHLALQARIDTVSVSGRVRCGGEPVESAIVSLLQPSDSSIVAYSVTDRQGRYSLQAATRLGEVLVRVAGFNIKRQVVRVEARSQTLDFSVEEENMLLREVMVKSRKLWGSRDTPNYLVSAYTREHDRTIGDVLRQLPGITVEDNGVIKYQGTPINHFYIENLDMLQGRYNLATEGIKAGDVSTVQVLENHEHVRALQDQTRPDRAAINLKLKDKAKGVWTKAADLGIGGFSDGPLWDVTLQAMYFDKNRQHMFRYSGDNMGRGYDASSAHYGLSLDEGPYLTDIVRHGHAPVGNSHFGYRHGVNLNNLVKCRDSATVHYNFNYSYGLSHGSSFSRTTYILPDDSELLLTEDIADRTHAHSADLQLTYEKNAERRFLNNTLALSGRWDEGRGNVVSDGSAVSQASHYRSLGVANRTRLVRRTAKGGGFEWNSTNRFSSTPQALAVGGGMTARQDVDILSASTTNSFETLRDLRTHRWTLSASAHLNAAYTALSSGLAHPDAPVAAHGDMGYLHADAGLGPVVRYVNGAFQSTLRLPVSLAYTSLANAPVPGEETDADRMRLLLHPSFSLLWKANDNFTFNADAGYSADETPWERLLTASVMQNYRSLSRYRATLDDSHRAEARVKVSFKDLFSGFFAHLEGRWDRSWSDIAYGSTLDEQAHTVIEAAYMPNYRNRYSLGVYGRKDIDWHTTQIELSASGTRSESELLRQSVLATYHTTGYVLRGTLAFDIVSGYRVDYSATWQRNRSVSAGHATAFSELEQQGRLNLRLWPSRLFLNLHVSHTHNSSLASGKKDYLFVGGGLLFKMSKRVEFNLDGDNLTNIHTYTTRSLGDMEEYYTEYHLRPLSVTLTAHIYL